MDAILVGNLEWYFVAKFKWLFHKIDLAILHCWPLQNTSWNWTLRRERLSAIKTLKLLDPCK